MKTKASVRFKKFHGCSSIYNAIKSKKNGGKNMVKEFGLWWNILEQTKRFSEYKNYNKVVNSCKLGNGEIIYNNIILFCS